MNIVPEIMAPTDEVLKLSNVPPDGPGVENVPTVVNISISEVLASYQAITRIIAYEGRYGWGVFSTFVVMAGTLLAASISPSSVVGAPSAALAGLLFDVVGFVVTTAAYSAHERSNVFYIYWFARARLLETHLPSALQHLICGRELAELGRVSFSIPGEPQQVLELPRIAATRTRWLTTLIFFIFVFGFSWMAGRNSIDMLSNLRQLMSNMPVNFRQLFSMLT